MSISITPGETDDPYFITLVNHLATGLTRHSQPAELWIIQIDNWFDHKWLRFSGIGVVDFPLPAGYVGWYGAQAEFFQDKVTHPPFTPSRVVSQWSFQRKDNDYQEVYYPKLPHSSDKQSSRANLHKRAENFRPSACFIWFSGNTVANDRGSVMVYDLSLNRVNCWFVSFRRRDEWTLQATKGVSQKYVKELIMPFSG